MAGCCKNVAPHSLADLKSPRFWRGLFAELIGTFLLVLIGCGSCLGKNWASNTPTVVQISLTFGLAVGTIVWCIGHISGGHINPAVTLAMFVSRKASLVKLILYIVVQCGGAILGSIMLACLTPRGVQGNLGMTSVQPGITVEESVGVEMCITFVLVLTVFASCDINRNDLAGSRPLSIGLSVSLCHLFAIKYTGASMNPARSFGPAVMTRRWENHWIYWVGPMVGAVVASLMYTFIFSENASPAKIRRFFTQKSFKEEELPAHGNTRVPGQTIYMVEGPMSTSPLLADEKPKNNSSGLSKV